MTETVTAVAMPAPMQVALELTCALVNGGKFRFHAVDSQGRFEELLQFVFANAPKVQLNTTTIHS
jgi:hypothetical protein